MRIIIGNKLKPFRKILDDENLEKEIEAHLQEDYLFASAMHGHKMSLVKSERTDSPPPESESVPMSRQDYELEGMAAGGRGDLAMEQPSPRINKAFVESLMDPGGVLLLSWDANRVRDGITGQSQPAVENHREADLHGDVEVRAGAVPSDERQPRARKEKAR